VSHWLGLDDGNGTPYLFYSGIFSVLVFAGGLAGNAYVTARKHNCHVRGCWRIGRRAVPGTSWLACNRHHPEKPPTHEHMLAVHRQEKS